jgi:hypothetical protein
MEAAVWVLVGIVGYLGYACWCELKKMRSLLERLPAREAEDLQVIRAELTSIRSAMLRWEEAEHQRQLLDQVNTIINDNIK